MLMFIFSSYTVHNNIHFTLILLWFMLSIKMLQMFFHLLSLPGDKGHEVLAWT